MTVDTPPSPLTLPHFCSIRHMLYKLGHAVPFCEQVHRFTCLPICIYPCNIFLSNKMIVFIYIVGSCVNDEAKLTTD